MNTIAALVLALAPLTANTASTTASLSRMADARAEQLADARVAESLARLSANRAERVAPAYRDVTPTSHAPALARTTVGERAGG